MRGDDGKRERKPVKIINVHMGRNIGPDTVAHISELEPYGQCNFLGPRSS